MNLVPTNFTYLWIYCLHCLLLQTPPLLIIYFHLLGINWKVNSENPLLYIAGTIFLKHEVKAWGTPSIHFAWGELSATENFGPLPRLREVLKEGWICFILKKKKKELPTIMKQLARIAEWVTRKLFCTLRMSRGGSVGAEDQQTLKYEWKHIFQGQTQIGQFKLYKI